MVGLQSSLLPAGALAKLVQDAESAGKLVFHDEELKRSFHAKLDRDYALPEVPPERVDFSLPLWMQGPAPSPSGANLGKDAG